MRSILAVLVLAGFTVPLGAADPPLVEKYLHSGELAKGEVALLLALENNPNTDQIRFGLGVLQFGRAVERLGQSLHEYGAKADNTNVPFLRVPVPKNENPSTISYRAFGRVLDQFASDLMRAEKTLAGVKDKAVKLPLIHEPADGVPYLNREKSLAWRPPP